LLVLPLLVLLPGPAAAAAAATATPGSSSSSWSGPALSIRGGGDGTVGTVLPQLVVDGKPAGPPLWLVLHLTYADNFTALDEQVRQAARAGLRVVCLCLTQDIAGPRFNSNPNHNNPWLSDTSPMDNRTKGVFDRIIQLHPRVLFIIRFYAFEPDIDENIVMMNMTDENATKLADNATLTDGAVMNALTLEYEAAVVQKMTSMLRYLDAMFPGKIAGAFPCYLHTSEWFMPGPNDLGIGGHSKLSDYSDATRRRYCAEAATGSPGNRRSTGDADCQLPLPSQRDTAALGNAFADAETTRLNLYYASAVAHAIETLASAAKRLSGGKLLTLSFYGCQLRLCMMLTDWPC
jgi:hypothetical protein